MRATIEAQYDPERRTVTCTATVYDQQYVATMPASSPAEAHRILTLFADMYRELTYHVVVRAA